MTLGWRFTKSLTAPADTSITSMDSTIATIMIETSLAIPTAVITESSEKTMSSSKIWTSTSMNAPRAAPAAVSSWPASSLSWISQVALAIRKRPPPSRIRSRPETPRPSTEKSGAVSPMIQVIASSRPMRMPSASESPSRRAQRLLVRRQPADQDGEEDDVVDAEDDLHRRQRDEGDEAVRGQEGTEHDELS